MSDLKHWYNDNYDESKNTAMALFNIAEAIEKLANSITKQDQDSKTAFKKELANISDKTDQLYKIVETAIAKQDIETIKEQLGQIYGRLTALNQLILKKESP